MSWLFLAGTQPADDLPLQAAFILGCGQVAQLALERAVEPLIGIEFRAVTGQVMHGDGVAMRLQPGLHRLAVMHPQVVENQTGLAPLHRAHQPLQEPDEQGDIQRAPWQTIQRALPRLLTALITERPKRLAICLMTGVCPRGA